MADEPWCIYIDVEGFSALLPQDRLQAFRSLGEIMRAVFRIGTRCYPEPPESLLAYQFGDGFLISSELHEASLDRCIAVATAIMRHVVGASGCYTRAAVAEGELADIQGCYPDEVMAETEDHCQISLHGGLMVITPVLGNGLVQAYSLADRDKPDSSGPLLVVAADDASRIAATVPRSPIPNSTGLVSIDWIHMESDLLTSVQTRRAELNAPSAIELEADLAGYCARNRLKPEWVANARDLLGAPVDASVK